MNFLPVNYYCQQKKSEKHELIQFGAFIKNKCNKMIPPILCLKIVVLLG